MTNKTHYLKVVPQSVRDFHLLVKAGAADTYRDSGRAVSAIVELDSDHRELSFMFKNGVELWLLYRKRGPKEAQLVESVVVND